MLYSTFSSSCSPPSLSRSLPLVPGTGRLVTTANCTFSPASSDATATIPKIQIPISHSVGPLGHGSIFLKLTLLRAPHRQPSSRLPPEDFHGLREFRKGRVGLFGDSLASFTQTYVHKQGSPRAAAVRAFFSPDPSVRRSRSAIAPSPSPRKASAFLRAPRHEIVSLAHRPARSRCSHHPHILSPSAHQSVRRRRHPYRWRHAHHHTTRTYSGKPPQGNSGDECGYGRRRMQRNGDFCKGGKRQTALCARFFQRMDEFEGMA